MTRKTYHNVEILLFGVYIIISAFNWGKVAIMSRSFIVFCISDLILMIIYYFWNNGLHYFEKLTLEKKLFFLMLITMSAFITL